MVTRATAQGPASVLDAIVETPASNVPTVPAESAPAPQPVPEAPPAQ
jgi:hypothetical protein